MSSVALLIIPRVQFLDSSGKPLAGGKVFTYQAGTTTPQATFVDSTGTIQNANPVILDAGGMAVIFLAAQSYKIKVQNSAGVDQWTVDNVQSFNGTITATANITGTLTSSSANPATVGFIRLASGDVIRVRNNANSLDLAMLSLDASDRVVLGDTTGVKLPAFEDFVGITPQPALSSAGQTRFYMDSVINRMEYSENAGNFKLIGGILPGSLLPATAEQNGNSADQAYFTWTLPAKVLFGGSGIRITAISFHSTGAGSIIYKLSFGGTLTTGIGLTAGAAGYTRAVYEVWNNAGVTNAQTIVTFIGDKFTAGFSFVDTAAVDTQAGAVTINTDFNVAAGDKITPKIAWIEHIGTN